MVKVGPGTNGIVMSGEFTSDPYQGEDWSGKERQVFYMDMELKEMIHPGICPLLTSEELAREIPDFVWTGGHSGQLLTEEQAVKLQELWIIEICLFLYELKTFPTMTIKQGKSTYISREHTSCPLTE